MLLDRAPAIDEDPWRVLRIMGEFVEGFEAREACGGDARSRAGTGAHLGRRQEGQVSIVDIVSREDLKGLVEVQQTPCVSLYQPTHRTGPDTRSYAQQDLIRFRNLLREAERRLGATGLRTRQVRELLGPVRRLRWKGAPALAQLAGVRRVVAP